MLPKPNRTARGDELKMFGRSASKAAASSVETSRSESIVGATQGYQALIKDVRIYTSLMAAGCRRVASLSLSVNHSPNPSRTIRRRERSLKRFSTHSLRTFLRPGEFYMAALVVRNPNFGWPAKRLRTGYIDAACVCT